MINLREFVCNVISEKAGLDRSLLWDMLEYPPNEDMGDVALPCFKLSKILRKSPMDIASSLAKSIEISDGLQRIDAVSGYLNFYIDKKKFIKDVIESVLNEKDKFGAKNIGEGNTVVIDFSAPNIAKPFHIGHLRSTVIGNSIYKLLEFMGYRCVGVNHLGDWGTQFGKLIVAYKKWGKSEESIEELMKLYVRFHDEAKNNPELEEEARAWFVKMEQGDKEALDLWHRFKEISLREFKKIYDLLGVNFDSYAGESFYNDKMEDIIEELKNKEMLKRSEGALIVDLEEYNMPPCLVLKKDGSTLYATRDIAAALYRKKEYSFVKCIYVTGVTQTLHFKQVTKVIEMMGHKDVSDNIIHVPFGTVSLGGEKLSTREGRVILLEEILSEAINKTSEVINSKNPNLQNKEEVAKQIGVGAVVFSDLSSNRIKDVSFSWDEILNFEGETGPYVQYTYARASSVLGKAGNFEVKDFDCGLICKNEEFSLVKSMYLFPERVELATRELEPSIITRYLIKLAQDFNRFYHECPVLVGDPGLRNSRLALVKAVHSILGIGLKLIGLNTLERI